MVYGYQAREMFAVMRHEAHSDPFLFTIFLVVLLYSLHIQQKHPRSLCLTLTGCFLSRPNIATLLHHILHLPRTSENYIIAT